ncbi:another transcription unit protein-like isoform X2 [Venturia nashicola]|uniref:Another transcription unit protein-like isoform X2 n=1 Tax=Venturia nashicola TaxID=86259 RepID=A0A4Z1NJZ6_9PEZI|nr:another transcription unit protein-like isoform X2 [Venturia nashicola]TLD21579.1 another transcription unit protein-like isoform X2 [Venturia nashicola]
MVVETKQVALGSGSLSFSPGMSRRRWMRHDESGRSMITGGARGLNTVSVGLNTNTVYVVTAGASGMEYGMMITGARGLNTWDGIRYDDYWCQGVEYGASGMEYRMHTSPPSTATLCLHTASKVTASADDNTASAGNDNTASASDDNTASASDDNTASASNNNTASASNNNTASASDDNTASASNNNTASASNDNPASASNDNPASVYLYPALKETNGDRVTMLRTGNGTDD